MATKARLYFSVDECAIVDRVGGQVVVRQPLDHRAPAAGVEQADQARALRGQGRTEFVPDRSEQRINECLPVLTRAILRQKLRSLHEHTRQIQLPLGDVTIRV